MSQKLEQLKNSISVTLAEIQRNDLAGLSDPECREAYDIICRVERKLLSKVPAKRSA